MRDKKALRTVRWCPPLREHKSQPAAARPSSGPQGNARPATDGWRVGVAYFFSVVVVVVDVDAGGGAAVVVVVVDEVVVGSDGLTWESPPPHATPTADTAARTTKPITFFMIVASTDRLFGPTLRSPSSKSAHNQPHSS